MVFLGIVFKTRLKYSKELFDHNVKIQKLPLLIIIVTKGIFLLQKLFHDKSPYTIMFGPDKCGEDKKVKLFVICGGDLNILTQLTILNVYG